MTKIRDTGSNPYIDDRRGQGGGASGSSGLPFPFPGNGRSGGNRIPIGLGGGVLGIIVLLASLFLPRLLNGSGTSTGVTGSGGETVPATQTCNTETAQIVCGAVSDVNEFWIREFAAEGKRYTVAKTVFYNGATETACGTGQAETGPFYCPLDSLVYFDLDFLDQLQQRFDAQGDLASQYIVAHEYGHHVQNLVGTSEEVRQLQAQDPGRANELSVKLELQADCLAGVWAHDAEARALLEPGDLKEALDAAAAVGDDRIQQSTQGRVNPDTFTHGSSADRMKWFTAGYKSGSRTACDTFNA